ncbi:MAG: hypothetical protein NC115_00725 [Bacteroidales bacterium]|nr:hypothetical protein [Bacteroidales bacterium]
MKNIFSKLCVLMSAAAVFAGCQDVVDIVPLPEDEASLAKTGPATIDETEVTLEGTFIYEGESPVSAGFRYAKTQTELEVAQTIPAKMAGADSFYLTIPDVANGEYWYQSVVEIGNDVYYGKEGFFKVDFSLVPSITTLVAEITDDAYVLKGSYVFESKKISIVPGFFYSATEDGLETATFVRANVNGKNFSYEVPSSFGEECWYQAAALVNEEYYRGATRFAGLTNLSARGDANCFVVSQPGAYVFDTKKADGTEVTGDTADWIWCTGAETILSEISYNDGRIMFSAGDRKGSEVIALLKDGEVQWSWHVWVTDEIKEQSYYDVTMMDRNLGAMSDDAATADAIGLMYQWGRKDPFIGTNVMDKTISTSLTESYGFGLGAAERVWTAPYIVNTDVLPDGFKLQQVRCTEEQASKNPMVFYGNWNSGDWAASNSEIQDYWGGVSLGNTMNNPCPAGYRVPTHSEMVKYINGIVTDGEWQYANYAMTWGRKAVYNGETYNFPATGWREWHCALTRPGSVIAMNTSTLAAAECRVSIYWDFNTSPGTNLTCQSFPVRCIKIK